MHTLYIHIGTPKTGTSTIQHFLFNNRKWLENKGYRYPIYDDHFSEGEIIANGYVFDRNHIISDKNGCGYVWNEIAWNSIEQALCTSDVILSSELFWLYNDFYEDIRRKYGDIKIIVYLRRQDLCLESCYAEMVRRHFYTGSIEELLGSEYVFAGQLHYLKKLDYIAGIVGKENLVIRPFEKEQFIENDLLYDFLYLLGIKKINIEADKSDVNVGLHPADVEIMKCINVALGLKREHFGLLGVGIPRISNDYFSFKVERSGKEMGGYLSVKERRELLKRYEYENHIIAKEYLGREDGVLFFNENTDIPQIKKHFSFEQERLMLPVISYMANEHRERHITDVLSREGTLKGNRSLAMFGAGGVGREILDKYILPIKVVIDNNRKGENICGKEIIGLDGLPGGSKNWFILIAVKNPKDIEKQLSEYGYIKDADYVCARDWFSLVNWNA